MAQNLQIDPKTKDYVMVNGSPVASDRVLEACYFALLIPQGKWLYGQVGQGSLLYTLQNQKKAASVEQTFAAFASDAIKRQVVDTGQATSVAVHNVQQTPTGTVNEIDVVPKSTQLSQQINFVSV